MCFSYFKRTNCLGISVNPLCESSKRYKLSMKHTYIGNTSNLLLLIIKTLSYLKFAIYQGNRLCLLQLPFNSSNSISYPTSSGNSFTLLFAYIKHLRLRNVNNSRGNTEILCQDKSIIINYLNISLHG